MDISNLKKTVAGVSLTFALLAGGTALGTTAQAQERDRNHQRQQDRNDQRQQNRNDQRDQNHDRNWNRGRNDQATTQERNRDSYRQQQNERTRDRDWRQEQQRGRDRYAYSYPAPRTYNGGSRRYEGGYSNYGNGGYSNYGNGGYSNYGSYGNYGNSGSYGGGYANSDVQRGYFDGLNKGQEDARDHDSFNPNNSSHFRSGSSAYRQGFARGYSEGYRQYAGNRGW